MRRASYIALMMFFCLLIFSAQALAATQIRRPTSDNSASGSWSIFPASPATYYDKVNESVADDDSSYIWCTAVGRNLYNFPVFTIPSGATISQLSITYVYERRQGGQTSNIRSALLVRGTNYDTIDPGVTPPANPDPWPSNTYNYSTNPKTGVAWTADDINGVGTNELQAFGVYSSDVTRNPYVTQVYATVTYTVPNSPPIGGYTADNVIPAAQCVQSTDGNGIITISFRVKDLNLDPCTLKTFQYSVNGGASWPAPTGGDGSGALSAGWTNNGGANYTSADDFTGPVYSFTFNTKHGDVSGLNGVDQNDVRIRFTVNDGALDSTSPAASENFTVDDLNPAALAAVDVTARPNAGDTAISLDGSFTENHPNTNTFSVAINGGAYGAGSAGQSNTADPAAHDTPVGATLDGNDYVSGARIVHVDDYGNSGTNQNLAPSTRGVKPYTPSAPTVSNPTINTVDVTVNKNAGEAVGLQYAIYVSSHTKYVQADGTLGDAAAWQTIAAWGVKTVTGLSTPVSDYVFSTKSRNPNGDNPESDLSGGASSSNTAPQLNCGTIENCLYIPSQATDGGGDITITFRIKDLELDTCSVVAGSFQYQVNGGGWNNILDADITGTKTGLSSAADLTGTIHTLVWNTSKEYIDDAYSTNVQIRFKVNDGISDSVYGVSPTGFDIDNLDPATLLTTDVYTQPRAGQSSVTLKSSFTEDYPDTNTFYAALNGGDYGTGTIGDSNTADPSPQSVPAGKTLDGSDYVNKARCVHVDDFGNTGNNENTDPDASKKYIKPYTPAVPTASNGTDTTVDVRINKNPGEVTGLEYAIYVSSHNKYVQTDGTLGDNAAWQTIVDWGTTTVTGLSSPVSDYYFKTKSRNSSDTIYQASSQSDLSDPANTSGVPPTPEAIVSYSPAAGAEGVSPEAKVIILFDRDIDSASVQSIYTMEAIYDNTGVSTSEYVPGGFAWSLRRELTYSPSSVLKKGYTYRVSLVGTAQDYDGNDVTLDLAWSFRISLDREITNIFYSSDGRVKVELSEGAMSNDGQIDINRNPLLSPQEVDPSAITIANNKVLARGLTYFYPLTFFISEINAYGIDDVHITSPFAAPVTVTMYYDDENNDGYVDDTDPRVLERGLVLYRLDEANGLWVKVPGSTVNSDLNYVSALAPHFSVYTLMATPAYSLSEAYAFPNPFKPSDGHTSITFTNLSSVCTIKIYTLKGALVKTIEENDGDAQMVWNVKNEAGEDLASGLYLFVIRSDQDLKRGKFLVIR